MRLGACCSVLALIPQQHDSWLATSFCHICRTRVRAADRPEHRALQDVNGQHVTGGEGVNHGIA